MEHWLSICTNLPRLCYQVCVVLVVLCWLGCVVLCIMLCACVGDKKGDMQHCRFHTGETREEIAIELQKLSLKPSDYCVGTSMVFFTKAVPQLLQMDAAKW